MKSKLINVQLVGQQPRGHVLDLLQNPPEGVCYHFVETPSDSRYGKPAMHHQTLFSKMGRSKLANTLGIFLPVIKFTGSEVNVVLSLNRFYLGNCPNIVWLERPMAPLHYEPKKLKNPLTKRLVNYWIQKRKTRFVCWSNACADEFREIFNVDEAIQLDIIPPLVVPPTEFARSERVIARQQDPIVRILFVGSRFHNKGGKETLIAFEKFCVDHRAMLTIVSDEVSVGNEWMSRIRSHQHVQFVASTMDRISMWKLYDLHHVLVFPTIYDSYGLVCLEAIRMGIPVIATSVYATAEIIGREAGIILCKHYKTPFPLGYQIPAELPDESPDHNVIRELLHAMKQLSDVGKRSEMSLRTFRYAQTNFGEECLNAKWKSVYDSLVAPNS